MAQRYVVNRNAQVNGDHEVHTAIGLFLPAVGSRIDLGEYPTCASAVIRARQYFQQVNGCYFCATDCHTQ